MRGKEIETEQLSDALTRFTLRLTTGSEERALALYRDKIAAVNSLEPKLSSTSELDLHQEAQTLTARAREGNPLNELLIDFFALVREVARRMIGLRPFDVQVLAGIGLHAGKVIQMGTGEGKTLAAVSPVALHALRGQGVHVLTFNDYLARRDSEWMGPIYRFLGLGVGFVEQGMSRCERRKAYEADVTYVTAKEAGFDFLRDGLAYQVDELVHRPFHAAVVDEADSILIDEARVPLVIAGATERLVSRQDVMRQVVEQLKPGLHFASDDYQRNVFLTEEGALHAEELLGCGDLYAPGNLYSLTELNLALHAEALMRSDVDYIVRHDRVEIVDDFTGRVVQDRHWPDGLQAAIEAKEGVAPSEQGRVLGSVTLQHFLRQYPHLCGMTATADPAAEELRGMYGLEVMAVPPNRHCIRIDHPDRIFSNRDAKQCALLAEIDESHRTGRPVLVGTLTVKESETLAADLATAGIRCNVLNAKRDAEEAKIVAEAGAVGAVTISTNMAGRGTDIRLGGSDGGDRDEVVALGGLYVIGTNRHESRRIDDQLRGRAGRQGDPGSSRFIISLEDDLLLQYGISDVLPKQVRAAVVHHPIDSAALRRKIDHVQRVAAGQSLDIRQNLWRYSRFVEQQRQIIFEKRRQVLIGTVEPNVLRERVPAARERARRELGEAALQDLERRLMLHAIDQCWSDHLATVADVREGIHLAQVGGLSSLEEFHKLAAASFDAAVNGIDDRVSATFASLEITSDGVDMGKMGLRGPSSTWTFLVNDDPFTDRLAAVLVSGRNIGFSANAALTGPLLLLWALSRRMARRRRK